MGNAEEETGGSASEVSLRAASLAAGSSKLFDLVVWSRAHEEPMRLTPAEFVELPLTSRVRALLAQELVFYQAGEHLPTTEALRRLAAVESLLRL